MQSLQTYELVSLNAKQVFLGNFEMIRRARNLVEKVYVVCMGVLFAAFLLLKYGSTVWNILCSVCFSTNCKYLRGYK